MASALRSFLTPQRLKELVRKGQDLQELHPWTAKLLYSSHLEKVAPTMGYRRRLRDRKRTAQEEVTARLRSHQVGNLPVALKFATSDTMHVFEEACEDEEVDGASAEETNPQYPYRILSQVQADVDVKGRSQEGPPSPEEHEDWFQDYGKPNLDIPPTDVPCGGCGALLHCQDTAIPGYVPSERLTRLSQEELLAELCQRCYFLRNHRAALKVNVSAEDYTRVLSDIKNKYTLVVLLVDLLDFPCSLWPGLMDIIGPKRPVILVGNKVDLLPRDSRTYLRNLEAWLKTAARENGLAEANLVHTALISATTGFGVENLISHIFKGWGFKGDIYLMGCTNVGKSSLFNALLQSDLCKVQVVNLVQRATISPWPGTTLNLLKFPVTRPEPWRLAVRNKRLREEQPQLAARNELRLKELKATRDPAYATLIGHIGRSFVDPDRIDEGVAFNSHAKDIFQVNPHSQKPAISDPKPGQWDPSLHAFKLGKWCYDTPGAVADNQILDQLTLQELMLTLPKEVIEPRTYLMKTGLSLFVAGLARLDYLEGPYNIRFTVCSSHHLPIAIVNTEDADDFYAKALGSVILGVPFGSEARLKEFPPLESREFKLTGTGHKWSCADLVISSAGWVAVTAGHNQDIRLEVHTPGRKGVFCRVPSMLPELVQLSGGKIRGSLAYAQHRVYVPPNLH